MIMEKLFCWKIQIIICGMLQTISSVSRESFYHSWLAVLSTGCQHFAWLAVCRKWRLKTDLDYKSYPRWGQVQCYRRPVPIYKPTADSLHASVQVCCSLQIISIPDKIRLWAVFFCSSEPLSSSRGNTKIERRSRSWLNIIENKILRHHDWSDFFFYWLQIHRFWF